MSISRVLSQITCLLLPPTTAGSRSHKLQNYRTKSDEENRPTATGNYSIYFITKFQYYITKIACGVLRAPLAQLAEHSLRKRKVSGSNPLRGLTVLCFASLVFNCIVFCVVGLAPCGLLKSFVRVLILDLFILRVCFVGETHGAAQKPARTVQIKSHSSQHSTLVECREI